MNRAAEPISRTGARTRFDRGFAYGLSAYALWGVMPIYFKAIGHVSPVDIVAHRVLWSLPFLGLIIALSRGWGRMRDVLASRRTMLILTGTAALIAVNWLLFVYSVTSGHILAASLGYYLNPLVNVLLGRFVLKEGLTRLQWTAVAIAAAGTAVLAVGALSQLWISLTLGVTFALYGLLRKVVDADAVTGLAVETGLLFPLAFGWLALRALAGASVFGTSTLDAALLALAGIATTGPLVLFTAAARRLAYSTLGMLQFIAPTLQFLLAVFFYGEHFTLTHAVAFSAIWLALALYVAVLIRRPRLPTPPE